MKNINQRRQELYEKISQTSKISVIYEEMVRLGFWAKDEPLPKDPPEEVKRREDLWKELKALRTELSRLRNVEKMKKEYRRRRMAESRKKRKENKERRIREKKERAEAWKQKKKTEIVYLGKGISAGLNNKVSNINKLTKHNIPVLHDEKQLAEAMGISIGLLRFLAYSRTASEVSHYIRFKVPKKTGGMRVISAPMPKLKRAQYWILENILYKIPVHKSAHGFVQSKSILTNAKPHIKPDLLINIDLKDFFPSISFNRVKGLFNKSFGYSECVATILASICTEADTELAEIDGQTYHIALSDKRLPQGAPTSPAITNLICRRLDARIAGFANKLDLTYTRYADDITLSAKRKYINPSFIIDSLTKIIENERFTVNENKTKIVRSTARQEVTGIVVNETPSVSRKKLKQFRALLFQIERDGLKGKRWGKSNNIIASIRGFANYVAMVNPKKGLPLKNRVERILNG